MVLRRVVAPTVATAMVSSAVAISVNFATEWKHNLWAWLAVLVLTAIGGGVALWLEHRQSSVMSKPPLDCVGPVVNDAVIGRDNIQIAEAGRDVNIDRV